MSSSKWYILAAIPIVALVAFGGVPGLPCMFKALYGMACPGCGLTRSVIALLHGNLIDSVRFHPLGPAAILILIAWTFARLAPSEWRATAYVRTALLRIQDHRATPLVFGGLFMGMYIVRLSLSALGIDWFHKL